MKIVFSTEGESLESLLDTRFGRCSRFLLWDFETKTFTLIENSQNLQALQGAGIQSAQNVINTGAEALVTGHCGPKAFKVLQAAGIPIYVAETLPIRELIDSFEKGTLLPLKEADVEGHW